MYILHEFIAEILSCELDVSKVVCVVYTLQSNILAMMVCHCLYILSALYESMITK